jgi:hypothetical protein
MLPPQRSVVNAYGGAGVLARRFSRDVCRRHAAARPMPRPGAANARRLWSDRTLTPANQVNDDVASHATAQALALARMQFLCGGHMGYETNVRCNPCLLSGARHSVIAAELVQLRSTDRRGLNYDVNRRTPQQAGDRRARGIGTAVCSCAAERIARVTSRDASRSSWTSCSNQWSNTARHTSRHLLDTLDTHATHSRPRPTAIAAAGSVPYLIHICGQWPVDSCGRPGESVDKHLDGLSLGCG